MEKHPDFFVFDALFTLLPDGRLVNKVKRGPRGRIGAPVGSVGNSGQKSRLQTVIFKKNYLVHRIVWLLHTGQWPKHSIDHIDGNPLNNCPENLRDVPHKTNLQNRSGPDRDGRTGFLGVVLDRRSGWYYSRATCPTTGKMKHLGRFQDPQVAATVAEAYREANYLGYVKRKEPHDERIG